MELNAIMLWIKNNKDSLMVIATLCSPIWAIVGVFLGSRLNLRSQKTAIEHLEKAKEKLSDGLLGLTLAEIIQDARLLLSLHIVIGECLILLHEQGPDMARAHLMRWLSLYEFKDSMWKRLTSSEVIAEKDADALVTLAGCYCGAESTFADARFVLSENGSAIESSFATLRDKAALKCSELASWATALLFTHKGLWDTNLASDTIKLLAEMHMKNLKADQVIATDEDVRKAMYEAIAAFKDSIIEHNKLLATNCDQALDALCLDGIKRPSQKEKARLQKRGLLPA